MRKVLLILPILLMGCVEGSRVFAPPETIINSKCETVYQYQIFQALENGGLAHDCSDYLGDTCWGLLVFIPAGKGVEYYDDQIIRVPEGKCAVYEGVYRYTTKQDIMKTIPKVKMIDAYVPNPAYSEWLNAQEPKQ